MCVNTNPEGVQNGAKNQRVFPGEERKENRVAANDESPNILSIIS